MLPLLLLRTLLFTLVAVASFSTWAFGSRFFESEAAMYAVCAIIFLGLGGLSLTPGSGFHETRGLVGFCLRFALGFIAYAVIWSVSWFTFRDTFGEVAGSFFGLLALLAILRREIRIPVDLLTATVVVFLWHTLGYYTGGLAYKLLQGQGAMGVTLPFETPTTVTLARLSWGLFYGLGLGFGLSSLLQRSRQS